VSIVEDGYVGAPCVLDGAGRAAPMVAIGASTVLVRATIGSTRLRLCIASLLRAIEAAT
jgi:hypothetical protein